MIFTPIGTILTEFTSLENMPIQPKGAKEQMGKIVIFDQFVEGLKDLEGFSHIYLFYHFHKSERTSLKVTPFMDDQLRGVFSTRSPLRPTKIGLSISQIVNIEDSIITVKGIDVLNFTPLLDIKPYIPQFDAVEDIKTGWMQKSEEDVMKAKSDERFIE